MCPSAAIHAILLLDWLEHLREPLLSSQYVEKLLYVSPVPPLQLPSPPKTTSYTSPSAAIHHSHSLGNSADRTSTFQFQPLHQLPACSMRSLDRVLTCLRALQAKLMESDKGVTLFDAVCVRTAMALFHLSTTSCSTASLRRHGDCVVMLLNKWHAPKRLELNMESLQKLSLHRPSTCRRLTQSAGSLTSLAAEIANSNEPHDAGKSPPKSKSPSSSPKAKSPTLSPSSSPTRTPRDPTSSRGFTLNDSSSEAPLPHQMPNSVASDEFPQQQPQKPGNESPTRPSITALAATTSSPRSARSSPVKIEPLASSHSFREKDGDDRAPFSSLPSTPRTSPKKVDLNPLPPQPAPEKDTERITDSFIASLTAELNLHSSVPAALPGVRDGDRYTRRTGNAKT